MSDAAALHAKAIHLARLVVRMTARAGSGHPSSALSLVHIVAHLMYRRMRHDPTDPKNPGNDRLILSQGHAVPVIYAAWADLGGAVGRDDDLHPLCVEDLDGLRERDSVLDGHPNPAEGFPVFDAATGSLGQGLSVSAGLALAARRDNNPRRFYCIIGDGEAREGQIWEAVDFIADYDLRRVCAIFNCNGQGQAGPTSPQQSAERIAAKLEAYGWRVVMIDGHDPEQIAAAFTRLDEDGPPLGIVARTVKGWGVEALQQGNWHGKPLKPDALDDAEGSLNRVAQQLAPGTSADALASPPAPPATPVAARVDPREVQWPGFEEAMVQAGFGEALRNGNLATRRAYGAALKVAGDLLPQVVVLDGDVSNSTFSQVFAAAHPDRFFECKIAEQNMISTAVGLAAAGCLPFVNSFAKFIARAYDQIELASISRANIKLVGSHAGITPSADGPSQMALADVAYFRAYTTVRGDDRRKPLAWVFQPADAVAAYHLTRLMTLLPGMCYMRTHRPDVPLIHDPQTRFEPGGLHVVRPGEDLALIGSGYSVHVCLRAAELLARQAVRAAVLDAYCLPLDEERLLDALQRAGGVALVVEDNYAGGFAATVAEAVARRGGGMRAAGLHCQRIPKSTRTPEEIFEYCGVAAEQIADHALAFLRSAAVTG